jgi:hypothetical protein
VLLFVGTFLGDLSRLFLILISTTGGFCSMVVMRLLLKEDRVRLG